MCERQNPEHQRERAIVERQDAERAPSVKHTEVPGATGGVQQDSGDQEARQYKEQINAQPTEVERGPRDALHKTRRRPLVLKMKEEDRGNGKTAHTIEHRYMAWFHRPW